VDSDKAQVETAKATLQADRAAEQNVQIQLGWTEIRSPIDGRTSSLNVYEGNVVAANNVTPLVSIAQVQPIYISFTVPEAYLDNLRHSLAAGTLQVEAMVEGIKKNSVKGAVSFLENTVNTTSGTIVLRATFANTDNRLYPGQFVDVIVNMPAEGKSVVIPAAAIQPSQQGNSVYIVDKNNKVRLVPVELARTHGDMAAIGQGISPGDVVVTDGQLQLMPGATIRVVDENGSPSRK
jgi:multidrug efflux system membrane fusion protein